MANSGINKFQVQKARDALLAKGVNPSIDAVRVELGNTGSKATIHRYLKEIADEQPLNAGKKVTLSETLSSMVDDLANQLHEEARALVEGYQTQHASVLNDLKLHLQQQTERAETAEQLNQTLQKQLKDAEQALESLAGDYQAVLIETGRLQQQVTDKDTHLNEKAAHISSLEEKHLHARDTLEHFRNAAKEQREQEQRRHEHQVQQLQGELRQLNQTISLKQTDITQLNKDNARLIAELTDSRRSAQQLENALKTGEEKLLNAITSSAILEQESRQKTGEIGLLRNTVRESESKLLELTNELARVTAELNVRAKLFNFRGFNKNF
jgi:chromosome segregation ATPase